LWSATAGEELQWRIAWRASSGQPHSALGDNVRLNSIPPGWIMTRRQIDLWLTPEAEAALMQAQCLKEKLHPPDIARMVLWLAADDSRLVTAQNFAVDGGRA